MLVNGHGNDLLKWCISVVCWEESKYICSMVGA